MLEAFKHCKYTNYFIKTKKNKKKIMDKQKAILILTEMNKWRKAQEPYAQPGTPMPYTSQEFSQAIEFAIKELTKQS